MAKTLLILFAICYSTNYGQNTTYFSDALKTNIHPYLEASNQAFKEKNFIEGKRLFDSLVHYKLVGTTFDDFTIKTYNSKRVNLNRINKPILIITYASWCIINKGEVPALNKLANEHYDDIQFIVLFWDTRNNIKNIVHQFSKDIMICYANESYRNDSHIVATLKHTLGFPTSFFIDENKKVVNIEHFSNAIKPKTKLNDALTICYNNFKIKIKKNLLNNVSNNSVLATN